MTEALVLRNIDDDDHDGSDAVFNNQIRDWLVSFIAFCILYTIALLAIAKLRKQEGAELELRNRLATLLSALGVSVALAALLLTPVTILANDALLRYGQSLPWLNRALIYEIWNLVFFGVNLSAYFVLPFAFFFQEAEGWRTGKFLSRVYEATLVWGLMSVVLAGLIFISRSAMHLFSSNLPDYIPFAYSLVTLAGSVIVLAAMPIGFSRLQQFGTELFRTVWKRGVADKKALRLDLMATRIRLEHRSDPLYRHWSTSPYQYDPIEDERLKQRELEVTAELSRYPDFNRGGRDSPLLAFGRWSVYNAMAIMVTLCNLVFPGLIILRAAVAHAISYFRGPDALYIDFLAPGATKPSHNILFTIVEILIIMYVTVAAFVGFYSFGWTSRFALRNNGSSIRRIIINSYFALLISSSLPLVTRTLSLISFDLMGYFKDTGYMKNAYLVIAFKVLFVVLLLKRYFEHVQWIRESVVSLFARKPKRNQHQTQKHIL